MSFVDVSFQACPSEKVHPHDEEARSRGPAIWSAVSSPLLPGVEVIGNRFCASWIREGARNSIGSGCENGSSTAAQAATRS